MVNDFRMFAAWALGVISALLNLPVVEREVEQPAANPAQ